MDEDDAPAEAVQLLWLSSRPHVEGGGGDKTHQQERYCLEEPRFLGTRELKRADPSNPNQIHSDRSSSARNETSAEKHMT